MPYTPFQLAEYNIAQLVTHLKSQGIPPETIREALAAAANNV